MFYGKGIIALIYVDDVLFFGTEQDQIDEVIKELDDAGLQVTVEDYVYDLLEFEVKTDKQPGKVALTQGGFTNKVLRKVGMLDSNKKINLEETMPLGIDAYGPPFDEPW